MTAKDFLSQGYRLDQRIESDIEEAANLHLMACSISAIQYKEDRVRTSKSIEAPFVKAVEKLRKQEKVIMDEIELLSRLKEQIVDVVNSVKDPDERLILQYRYIRGMAWKQIIDQMDADRATVFRWHQKALEHAKLPPKPVSI